MSIRTFIDLCAGIGGGRLGLEQNGLHRVGYSDTSRLAKTTYNLMFHTEGEVFYPNLKRIKSEQLPVFDFLIAGFPKNMRTKWKIPYRTGIFSCKPEMQ